MWNVGASGIDLAWGGIVPSTQSSCKGIMGRGERALGMYSLMRWGRQYNILRMFPRSSLEASRAPSGLCRVHEDAKNLFPFASRGNLASKVQSPESRWGSGPRAFPRLRTPAAYRVQMGLGASSDDRGNILRMLYSRTPTQQILWGLWRELQVSTKSRPILKGASCNALLGATRELQVCSGGAFKNRATLG